jgi:ribonuclease HI
MDELITIEFDGGSRGNPGPAGIGVVLRAADGTPLLTLGRFIGRATNNTAEYQALITGLQKAQELGAKKLLIRGDSELIIKQMRGEYRVRHPELKPLYEEAYHLLHQFKEAKLEHNLRHKNALADKLANLAMDKKKEVTEVDDDAPPDEPPTPASPGDRLVCMRCGMSIEVRTPSGLRPHQLRSLTCQCGQKMTEGPE